MAPFYHLVYVDWEQAIQQQAAQLDTVIRDEWGANHQTILDVSCGIGTQALGLAQRNYQVTASDLSPVEIERAKTEAQQRGLTIPFSVADMRQAHTHHQAQFDLVIACDNAVPIYSPRPISCRRFNNFMPALAPVAVSCLPYEIMKKRIAKPK